MTTVSVFSLSRFLRTADGMVVGPAWTEDLSRELLRALRLARPAAPDASPDDAGPETESFAVAARVFHEVLSLEESAAQWPVFAGGNSRSSLFKCGILFCHTVDEALALASCSEHSLLLAANVARWMLQFDQQLSSTVVFVSALSGLPVSVPAPRAALRVDVAVS